MVRQPRAVDIAIGYAWVLILAYGVRYPIFDIQMDGWVINWLTAGLIVCLVGSLIGVGFNVRHRNDPFSITGRMFNYAVAMSAFIFLFVTLPMLYAASPVCVMVLLLAALVSINMLWMPADSPIGAALPMALLLPLVLRYGFHRLVPIDQPGFWLWAEPVIVLLAILALQIVHRESARLTTSGHRAKWIWLHSLHSILLGLVLLALHRGAESSLVGAATNRASSAAAGLGIASGVASTTDLEGNDETIQDARSLIWLGGCISIVTSLGMAIKGGLLSRLLSGERIDPIGAVAFGMLFLVGIWTLFARDVAIRDRQLGAFAGLIWGMPMLFILFLTLLT